MPKKEITHIQNTEPGPPMAMAEATPAMLPLPTVPERTALIAWKGVIFPSTPSRDFLFFPNMVPMVLR